MKGEIQNDLQARVFQYIVDNKKISFAEVTREIKGSYFSIMNAMQYLENNGYISQNPIASLSDTFQYSPNIDEKRVETRYALKNGKWIRLIECDQELANAVLNPSPPEGGNDDRIIRPLKSMKKSESRWG